MLWMSNAQSEWCVVCSFVDGWFRYTSMVLGDMESSDEHWADDTVSVDKGLTGWFAPHYQIVFNNILPIYYFFINTPTQSGLMLYYCSCLLPTTVLKTFHADYSSSLFLLNHVGPSVVEGIRCFAQRLLRISFRVRALLVTNFVSTAHSSWMCL